MANGMKNSRKLLVVCRQWVGAALPRLVFAVRGSLFMVCGLLLPVFAGAAELVDPTLPPASIATPLAEEGATVVQAAGLQSIIIGKLRRAAIIDGDAVELGGRHGEAKLVEVKQDYVVLRGPQGRQVLRLFPDVKIIPKSVETESVISNVRTGRHKHKPLTSREDK